MLNSDIAAMATQLAYTGNFDSPNPTLALWPWALVGQLAQTISIITSSIPYLRPFLEAFPSGMFMSDEIRRRGPSATESDSLDKNSNSNQLYILRYPGRDPTSRPFFNLQSVTGQPKRSSRIIGNLTASSAQTRVDIGTARCQDEEVGDTWDAASQGSRSRIIKATTTIGSSWEERKGEDVVRERGLNEVNE